MHTVVDVDLPVAPERVWPHISDLGAYPAWMRLVHFTLCEYGSAKTADDFWREHPQLHAKKVLRLFYSRELMMSDRAKREFVEPDLAPLPKPRGRAP